MYRSEFAGIPTWYKAYKIRQLASLRISAARFVPGTGLSASTRTL